MQIASFFVTRGIPPEYFINLTTEEIIFYAEAIKKYYNEDVEKTKFWVNFWSRAFTGKEAVK